MRLCVCIFHAQHLFKQQRAWDPLQSHGCNLRWYFCVRAYECAYVCAYVCVCVCVCICICVCVCVCGCENACASVCALACVFV